MLTCKHILNPPKTILIKKKNTCFNNWIIYIFGPVGVIQVKFKVLFLFLTKYRLNIIYRVKTPMVFSKIKSDEIQLKNNWFGLHRGFFIKLNVVGVGYKFLKVQGFMENFFISLGYSHNIIYKMPNLFKLLVFKKSFIVWSYSKQQIKQLCFNLLYLRKKDSYKGKGIIPKYLKINIKEGKKSKA